MVRHIVCVIYVIKSKTIFDHLTLRLQMSFKVVSRTAETRTRSNETSFIKHVVILASAPTVPCIIWENKTLNAFENIVTGIHFNNKKDNQKLKHGGKELK